MRRYEKTSQLEPGTVEQEHFSLLINISSIRSGKVIHALEDYFVNGVKRKIICEKYNVNPGYLSLKIREIQSVSSMVYRALPFYINRLVRV
jgi:hypothetical protein